MKKTAFVLLCAAIIGLAGMPEPVWAQSQVKKKLPKKVKTTGKKGAPGEAYSATEEGSLAPANIVNPSAPKVLRYDVVADEHRDSIAGRLELVQQLILKHGRAYDYRSMTTAQLEKTLRELDDRLAEKAEMSLAPDALEASVN